MSPVTFAPPQEIGYAPTHEKWPPERSKLTAFFTADRRSLFQEICRALEALLKPNFNQWKFGPKKSQNRGNFTNFPEKVPKTACFSESLPSPLF